MQIDAILGIILAALLAAFFGSVIPRKLKERQVFNEAAKKFREAFAKELSAVKSRSKGDTPDADEILKDAFQKHGPAVEEFRYALRAFRKRDIPAFNQAWNEYHKDEDGEEAWYQYAEECTGLHDKYPRDPHLAAVERIEKLLEFAKP